MKNWRQILNFFRSNWGKILRRSCKETKPAKLLLKWTEPAVIAIRTKPLRYPLPNHRPRIPTPSPGNKAARVLSTRTIQVRIIVGHRRQLVGTLIVIAGHRRQLVGTLSAIAVHRRQLEGTITIIAGTEGSYSSRDSKNNSWAQQAYLIRPGAGFRIQRLHQKNNVALCPGAKKKKNSEDSIINSWA